MKIRKMYLSLALIVSIAGLAAHAAPYDGSQSGSRLVMENQNQNVQEPKAIAPSETMRALNVLVGDWRFDIKFWQDAARAPEEMRGTTNFKYILGGSYIQGHYKGEVSGLLFEGFLTISYDNAAQQYVATWRHSFAPNIEARYVGQASLDARGNLSTLTLTTVDECWECEQEAVSQLNSAPSCTMTLTVANSYTLTEEMRSPDRAGNIFKSEEATYTRIQATPVPAPSGVK